MQPPEAIVLRDAYVAQFKSELPATLRVLACVPADRSTYTPDAKSMTAIDLAWHIASSEAWFLNGIATGQFNWDPEAAKRPAAFTSGADVVAWYEPAFAKGIAQVEASSGEHLLTEVDFAGKVPLVDLLSFAMRHSIHHCGQLSAYLRPMGSKVPSIYGPSGDDPKNASSEAAA